ncbi:sigma-70 family RNA polymerase sigma factor [Luteolibacter flavescens]|uniref:Sigma-70 family RNA polymerase sigma factor n=1 Tax=Luteolibacter flavescens TaxID=1859460 RepID=A0ABT3FML3_9BACT|nr:sigma-70 family RNA polymerase sigma factor [Luteolibacter flavescens]MCW1884215.1 sigma-70 family RNA polymerase sigma factor [Luteolibacter flavescens]
MLRRFAKSGDEDAFREIVARHAAMVHGVALRRCGDRTLAEDVTQTVFTILARKASSLVHGELAGWLHRAAFVEARNAYRKELRRSKAMSALTDSMNDSPPAPEVDWQAVRPHIDELLGKLSSQDRELVVLRYFEQRSYPEISRSTGATEDSIRKRVDRALDRLAGLLGRRGVPAQGTTLGVLLAGQMLCPAPASAATIGSVALGAAASGTAGTTLLLHSLFLMTTSTKIKIAAAALVILTVPAVYVATRPTNDMTTNANKPAPPLSPNTNPTAAADPSLTTTNDAAAVGPASPTLESEDDTVDLSAMLTDDFGDKMMVGFVKEESTLLYNKITGRLDLSDQQKTDLRALFDRRDEAAAKSLAEATALGLVEDGEQAMANAAKIREIVDKHYPEPRLDAFLKQTLTPEQYETHLRIDHEQRDESAKDEAQTQLETITKYVPLTDEEQQRFHDGFRQELMSEIPDDIDVVTMITGTIEVENARLNRLLTPEQVEQYRHAISEESRKIGEAMRKRREEREAREKQDGQ